MELVWRCIVCLCVFVREGGGQALWSVQMDDSISALALSLSVNGPCLSSG